MKKNEYNYNYYCDNCSAINTFKLNKGIRAIDFLKDKICENCGCKLIDEESKGVKK